MRQEYNDAPVIAAPLFKAMNEAPEGSTLSIVCTLQPDAMESVSREAQRIGVHIQPIGNTVATASVTKEHMYALARTPGMRRLALNPEHKFDAHLRRNLAVAIKLGSRGKLRAIGQWARNIDEKELAALQETGATIESHIRSIFTVACTPEQLYALAILDEVQALQGATENKMLQGE